MQERNETGTGGGGGQNPVIKVKRKTKTYESGSTQLQTQAVTSNLAGTGGSGGQGSYSVQGVGLLNNQKRQSKSLKTNYQESMEEDERTSKRTQPYRMMDINELDEHHMATITRKST